MNETLFGFEAISVLSVTFALSVVLLWQSARARRRARELQAVKEALEAHYSAMDKILDDPALPREALEMVASASSIISDRETSEWLAFNYLSGELFKERKYAKPAFFGELEALRKTRPDLMKNYDQAVVSALMVLTLRWPESASIFQLMMSKVVLDDRRKFQVVSKVAKHDRDRNHRHNGGAAPPATATAHC